MLISKNLAYGILRCYRKDSLWDFMRFWPTLLKSIMEKIIKYTLAGLLFLCLLDMPYGYFQFVRVASTLGFVLLAFQSYQSNSTSYLVIYVILAILFQPFEKIALGRELWNVVDVIVGVGLLLTALGTKSES